MTAKVQNWQGAQKLYQEHSDELIQTPLAKKIEASACDIFEIATVIILSLAAILVAVFCAKTHDPAFLAGFCGGIGGVAFLYLAYRTYKVLTTKKEIAEDEKNKDRPLLKKLMAETLKTINKKASKLTEQDNQSVLKKANYNRIRHSLS